MKYTPLFMLLLVGYPSLAQEAGYRNVICVDSSRRYEPSAHLGDRLYYRPIEIDCWYPAKAGRESPVRYGDFLRLFEARADRFQVDTVYSGLADQMARYLSAGLGFSNTASLTDYVTQSYPGATPVKGQFPLIVYMCSYNGMCFENIPLFEGLARHGYIVVSVTSVGRYPGNMTMDPADLSQQVADGSFAIRALNRSGLVDTSKIGLIGYSWGGPAALLLAARSATVAVLSLDGSELHYYGQSPAEDSDFNRLRPALLQSATKPFAYTYLQSGGKQDDGPADSLFDILPAFRGPKKYLRFDGATHEDFSCLPRMAARIGKKDSSTLPDYPDLAVKWFDHYLKNASGPFPRDSPYPIVDHKPKDGVTVMARVLDSEDRSPLAYVNVGIPGKNLGTVTGLDGSFAMRIDPQLARDTLAVSMVGYERQLVPLKDVNRRILLRRRTAALQEAVVTSPVRRNRTLGNTTTSKMVSIGFPMRFLGAEIGVQVALGRHPRRLESFHCHVSGARIDSAIFRLNIYRVVNSNPENILDRNILLAVGKEPGDYSVDLSGLNMVMSGDILVSLELLKSYSSLQGPGAVFFSAAFFNSGTWRRQTSQAEWKKAHGIGVGFNIEVR